MRVTKKITGPSLGKGFFLFFLRAAAQQTVGKECRVASGLKGPITTDCTDNSYIP
jgi:hypothetical protein